jgi:Zn-dependent M28 family amino/carboxypeptidase
MRLPLVPDPLPDRNAFIRSDQYSFIREGIPALFIKYGFAVGTPEETTEKAWRAERYHSPHDDLAQPVMKEEAVKLNAYVAALVRDIADDPQRPAWLPGSYFRRSKRQGCQAVVQSKPAGLGSPAGDRRP